MLRLPFYSGCWPENAKRSKHLSLTSRAPQKHTGTGRWGYETAVWAAQMDSSRNTSAINLTALRSAPPHRSRQSSEELCLGVFLYKNYRYNLCIMSICMQSIHLSIYHSITYTCMYSYQQISSRYLRASISVILCGRTGRMCRSQSYGVFVRMGAYATPP